MDFDIKSLIVGTLQPLGLPVSFGTAKDVGKYPFLVFNVTEVPCDFSDDEEEAILYMVALSVYCKAGIDFTDIQSEIIAMMKESGFKKEAIPPVQFIETENIYNQPLAFIYYNSLI